MPTTANGVSEVVPAESSELDNQQSQEQHEQHEQQPQEQKLTARELKMLEMTQRIREEREAENAGEPPAQEATPATVPATNATPAAKPDAGNPHTAGGTGAGAFDIFEKDGKQFVRLKAYGEVEEIPLETALRRAQKDVAAEKKLKEAIERERRAAYAEQSAAERLKALAQQPKITPSAQPTDDEVDLKGTLEKLYSGDIDAAATELKSIIQKGRPQATPVSSEQIVAQVEARLQQNAAAAKQARYDAELIEAAQAFEEEFPELAKDQRLSAYFDRETELLMAAHPGKSLLEITREAGETVRKLITPAQPQPSNPRLDLKRAAPKTITTARVPSVSTNIEPPPAPRTPTSVIAEMRKARGQAPR